MKALDTAFPPGGGIEAIRDPPRATEEQLALFHSKAHVDSILKKCGKAQKKGCTVNIDGDTAVMRGSGEAALRAAGAAVAAVDAVMQGRCSSAFCAVRPPGHHAEPDEAMGFCLFGNAGVAALHARVAYGLARVAVVDW